MIDNYNRQRSRLRLIVILCLGLAVFFAIALYRSAHAATVQLRLYHDQDLSATVTPGDLPAAGIEVRVTEIACTGQVCISINSAHDAYVVATNADGYVSLALDPGTQYEITTPCANWRVLAGDVDGQSVNDVVTCLRGVWLPVMHVQSMAGCYCHSAATWLAAWRKVHVRRNIRENNRSASGGIKSYGWHR